MWSEVGLVKLEDCDGELHRIMTSMLFLVLQWGIWWVCRQQISIQSQIKVANHPGKMDTHMKTNMEPETPVWKGESSSKPHFFLGSMLVFGGV